MVGMDHQAVRDWLHRYDAEGPEGLRDRPRGVFSRRRAVGGCAGLGGVGSGCGARWCGSVACSRYLPEGRGALRGCLCGRERLPAVPERGVRLVSGHPEHPRDCAEARSAFRSGLRSLVTVRLRSAFGTPRPVEVWFQDEVRVGQKDMMSRLRARRGARPRGVRDHRYGCCYLFGAACGMRGKAVAPAAMNAQCGGHRRGRRTKKRRRRHARPGGMAQKPRPRATRQPRAPGTAAL